LSGTRNPDAGGPNCEKGRFHHGGSVPTRLHKRVPRSFPGAVKRRSKTWHIRYYLPDGQRPRVAGYRDKKATETLAAELERRAIRLDAGIVEPTDEHTKRPMPQTLEKPMFPRVFRGK
jgi:hypothetical protein